MFPGVWAHDYAADVITLRDMLVQILGPEFTQLAMQNYGNHVPSQASRPLTI